MADIAAEAAVPFAARQRPPAAVVGPAAWARTNLFGSWWSTALTLLIGYLALRFAWGFVSWGLVHAVWSVPHNDAGQPNSAPCRAVIGIGACWAVISDKYRFILFGFYPYDEQWRPLVCIALFLGLYGVSANRRFWRRELGLVWIAVLALIMLLMHGSATLGMTVVTDDRWGGLPLTLILATFGLALAFPLAVMVALGRRSRTMPAVRLLCVVYVELIRGVPLISLLFMSSVMFPLFMPQGVNFDNLLRAQVAIILFAAAYLAEVVRGGLQALPKGQYEAADALGLSYGRKTRLIVLPQALRIVIPPLVNTFIGFFKDTSLVLIIGIYDLLQSGRAAVDDPVWQGFGNEVYILLAAIYFCFCFAMSKYSRGLERGFSRSRVR
ncbi:MAG: amino acid ABC transporter permease [Acidisphaera sp.]|nr:amino acid ABC transporter permease [Acidisphaera sp.]